jgi:hypothetical protein
VVIVAAFRDEAEAVAALRALERDGIAASVLPRGSGLPRLCVDAFAGGFDVAVEDDHAARAIALLQALWPEERPQRRGTLCPRCGAGDPRRIPRLLLSLLTAALSVIAGVLTGERDLFLLMGGIVVALLVFTPPLHCRSCGHLWRAPYAPAEEEAVELADPICPRCASDAVERIDRRGERALTLIANLLVPPFFLFWPMKPRWRCAACKHEWR